MSERSERISRLLKSQESRTSYIKSKLAVLVPAQIRTLRTNSVDPPMPYQRDLAREADLHQSRISMFETPGAANMTLETIAKIAAGLRVGVVIKFVPFSEMLHWENVFSPDTFQVTRLSEDHAFLNPESAANAASESQVAAAAAVIGNESAGTSQIYKRKSSLSVVSPQFGAMQCAVGENGNA